MFTLDEFIGFFEEEITKIKGTKFEVEKVSLLIADLKERKVKAEGIKTECEGNIYDCFSKLDGFCQAMVYVLRGL